MSYINLIQKDNPAVVWSLDDTTVTNAYAVKSNSLIDILGKDGTYVNTGSDIESIKFPIVFGGKSCISLTTVNGKIKIPSLDKMSRKDVGNESSLEFWVKVSNTSSAENVIVSKTNSETKIYIKNDYVVFRLGMSSNYREVAVQIDSINKPLHIIATYSLNRIGLIVNGVKETTEIKYGSEYDSAGLTRIESLFPVYLDTDEYFIFTKPSGISIINFDCVALYSYVLPREKALRHFVYGCGYNIPDEFVNKNAGVVYNFSMDNDSFIKKYFMGNGESWNITDYSNVYISNGSICLRDMQEPSIGLSSGSKKSQELLLYKDGYFDLSPSDSYLQIDNSESIIPYGDGGWLLRFDGTGITVSSTKQTLFYIGSDLSPNYIECYAINDSGVKIKIDINGTTETLISAPSIDGLFYVGYYVDSANASKSNIVFYPTSGTPASLNKISLNSLSIPNQYLRIGSTNTWKDGYNELTGVIPNQYQTLLKLKSIKAAKKQHFDSITWSYAAIGNAVDFYTATPNYYQKRFLIASTGIAKLSIPQQSLSNQDSATTGACKIDLGHPFGSSSATVFLTGKKYVDGTYNSEFLASTSLPVGTSITSGTWLNARTVAQPSDSSNILDLLDFTINLTTDDLKERPAKFNYLNIASFEINASNQVLCNSSSGGNPLKILKTLDSTFAIPDLKETPVLYNGFYSGFKVQNTYATIDNSFASLEGSGLGLVSFMLNVPYKSSGEVVKIMSFENGATVKSISVNTNTGVLSTLDTNIVVYVNGVIYDASTNKIKTNQWQNISVYLVTPYDIATIPTISIGESSQTVKTYHELYIDQLMLFYRPFADQTTAGKTITNIYNLLSGNVPDANKATDINTYNFKLNDSFSNLNGISYVGSSTLEEIKYQAPVGKFGAEISGQESYTYTTKNLTNSKGNKVSWGLQSLGATSNSNSIKFDDETGIFKFSSFNVNLNEHKISAVPTTANNRTYTFDGNVETISPGTPIFMRNYALENNTKESNKFKIGKLALKVDDTILFGKTYLYKVTSLEDVAGTPKQKKIVLTKQTLDESKVYVIGSKKYYYSVIDGFIENSLTREKIKSKVSPPTAQVLDQEQ